MYSPQNKASIAVATQIQVLRCDEVTMSTTTRALLSFSTVLVATVVHDVRLHQLDRQTQTGEPQLGLYGYVLRAYPDLTILGMMALALLLETF
jgi:hypothetical protein